MSKLYEWWRQITRFAVIRMDPQLDTEWDAVLAAYQRVYGVDPAPFWAHREEWAYHPGVEIDQYENGH